MAFTSNPDIDTYLINLLPPKEFLHFGMISKKAYALIHASPIYTELCRLKFDKTVYKLDSYLIIGRYYIHGMTNLIAQHAYDHYQAVVLATTYNHLDLLKLLWQTKSPHFPLGKYSMQNIYYLKKAIAEASRKQYYHILEWFEAVGIIDKWRTPTKIYQIPLSHYYQMRCISYVVKHASADGHLSMLISFQECGLSISHLWYTIIYHAFKHGHLIILDWIVSVIKDLPKQMMLDNMIKLPNDVPDSNKNLISSLLRWFAKNQHNFPDTLMLDCSNSCIRGQLATVKKIYCQTNQGLYKSNLLSDIVKCGNLVTLRWLEKTNKKYFTKHTHQIIEAAISQDNFAVIKWLEYVVNRTTNQTVIRNYFIHPALISGNIRILEWFLTKRIDILYDEKILPCAVSHGYIHVLAWLHEHNLLPKQLSDDMITAVLTTEHINILRWFGKDRIAAMPHDQMLECLNIGIKFVSLDSLQLLREYDLLSIDEISQIFIASRNNIRREWESYPIVCWLKEQNSNMNPHQMISAALCSEEWHTVHYLLQSDPHIDLNLLSVPDREKLKQYYLLYDQL